MSDLLDSSTPTSQQIPTEIISPELNSSERQPAGTNLTMVVYEKPFPKTFAECVTLFHDKALEKVAKLQAEARASTRLLELENSWENSKKWLDSEVARIYSFFEATKLAGVQSVKIKGEEEERIKQFKRLAALLKQAEEKAAEEARLLAEEKARKAEDARLAQEAEAAEKAKQDALVVSSSEPTNVRLERAIADMREDQQAIKEEQKLFRENLATQQAATNSLQSLLHQILEKLSSSNPSTSKD